MPQQRPPGCFRTATASSPALPLRDP
jgi:hypothetical protein